MTEETFAPVFGKATDALIRAGTSEIPRMGRGGGVAEDEPAGGCALLPCCDAESTGAWLCM
jgi:hypothetical protein